MELTKNDLIEKWGFRLALYTFASMFLVLGIFNVLPPDVADNSIAVWLRYILEALVLFPCLIGGILYLFLGAKFRSPISLIVGLSALFMVIFLLSNVYLQTSFSQENGTNIYGLIILISCCLLIFRRRKTSLLENKPIEKWGIRLAVFTVFVPLFASPVILFPHMLPVSFATRNLLMYLLLVLMIPFIVGGMFYLGLGAKSRSSKFASVALSSLLLTFQNFVMLFFVFSLLLDLDKH